MLKRMLLLGKNQKITFSAIFKTHASAQGKIQSADWIKLGSRLFFNDFQPPKDPRILQQLGEIKTHYSHTF